MRLPKNFAISRKSKVESFRWSKIVRYTYPGFECPKILRNLPKIFPKIEVRNPSRNCRKWSKLSKMIEIFGLFWIFRKSGTTVRPYKRRPSILSKYIHSKNAFKTVLARSGAEKNSFFCFWPFFEWFMDHFWSLMCVFWPKSGQKVDRILRYFR